MKIPMGHVMDPKEFQIMLSKSIRFWASKRWKATPEAVKGVMDNRTQFDIQIDVWPGRTRGMSGQRYPLCIQLYHVSVVAHAIAPWPTKGVALFDQSYVGLGRAMSAGERLTRRYQTRGYTMLVRKEP
jgi:hypothetical protein